MQLAAVTSRQSRPIQPSTFIVVSGQASLAAPLEFGYRAANAIGENQDYLDARPLACLYTSARPSSFHTRGNVQIPAVQRRGKSAAGRDFYYSVLAAIAFSAATAAFQRLPSIGPQLDFVHSGIPGRALRDAADSGRGSDLGAKPTRRSLELAGAADMGSRNRDLSAHGLRILVVALGQPYDPGLLAVPQCAPYRPRPRCEHGSAISFRRNGFFHWIPRAGRRGFRNRAYYAARFFSVPRSGNTLSSF